MLTWNKQTVRYFSSKDGFMQDQQRIVIRGLQSRWATHTYPTGQGKENSFIEGETEVGSKQSGFSLAELLPGWETFLFFLGSAIVSEHESSSFWSPDSI